MGQQQMLLIVLGVIIVGIAIFGALGLWEEYTFNSTVDQIRVKTDFVFDDAISNFSRPEANGGGGRKTFANWTPPKSLLSDPLLFKNFNKGRTKGTKTTATFYITTTLTDSKDKDIPIQGSVDRDNQRTRTWYDSGKKKWYRF